MFKNCNKLKRNKVKSNQKLLNSTDVCIFKPFSIILMGHKSVSSTIKIQLNLVNCFTQKCYDACTLLSPAYFYTSLPYYLVCIQHETESLCQEQWCKIPEHLFLRVNAHLGCYSLIKYGYEKPSYCYQLCNSVKEKTIRTLDFLQPLNFKETRHFTFKQ